MYLSNAEHYINTLTVTLTILQFLSGILVCKKYVTNKTTAESSPLPFVCGVVSCSLWLSYGLLKNDKIIVLVNIIGVMLMASYTIVFYIFTYKKSTVLKLYFATIAFLIFIIGYISVEEDHNLLLSRLGLVACSLTLLTIAAPMSKLLYVIKVKCTECLPFPMILMNCIVSALWFIYGVIVNDAFLELPNFIGAVLAVSQLSLFAIYPSKIRSPVGKSLLA